MPHVLVVDDEIEIGVFLENFLKRLKITSIKATSGEEALEILTQKQFDYVFLDIQMPGIDGLTVLRHIRKKYPDLKVIMITGREEKEVQTKARKMGAFDYITKPLDLSELKEKIRSFNLP